MFMLPSEPRRRLNLQSLNSAMTELIKWRKFLSPESQNSDFPGGCGGLLGCLRWSTRAQPYYTVLGASSIKADVTGRWIRKQLLGSPMSHRGHGISVLEMCPVGCMTPPHRASTQPLAADSFTAHLLQAGRKQARVPMVSRLRYPQSGVMRLTPVLPSDHPYCLHCPNLTMFS